MIEQKVDLGERSYPIFIGPDLLGKPEIVRPHIKGTQVLIVSNETVAPLYLETTKAAFQDFQTETLVLPDGEKFKTLDTLNKIFDCLLENRFDRKCTLIALGGGVIGDMVGFAAATYQRGVNFIQIPTTLLAQVDSSVGGKTAVNHPKGKNMIGAFYQPQCVIADTRTLSTLPERELSAGLAEVIKYGLIENPEFFDWLENNMDTLLIKAPEALAHAINISCACKARVVEQDEHEGGIRAILNLGHTFGHAIETATGYSEWLHGEAVGTGMLMAADMSLRLNNISKEDYARIERLIRLARLPIVVPSSMTEQTFMELMSHDKKVEAGVIKLILLEKIGKAIISNDYPAGTLSATLHQFCK